MSNNSITKKIFYSVARPGSIKDEAVKNHLSISKTAMIADHVTAQTVAEVALVMSVKASATLMQIGSRDATMIKCFRMPTSAWTSLWIQTTFSKI